MPLTEEHVAAFRDWAEGRDPFDWVSRRTARLLLAEREALREALKLLLAWLTDPARGIAECDVLDCALAALGSPGGDGE